MTAAVDKAYAALRQKIVSGELASGDRLKEREICTELDVSRTPVREALRQLQADGLVVIEPRRGGVVAGISHHEAEEIYGLGVLLESYGARLAATRAEAEDLAKLDKILLEMEEVLRDDTPARLLYVVREDDRFIASNVLFSRSDEFKLSAQERVVEERTDNAVLVIATNRRLIAYSVYTASWATIAMKAGESLEQLEAEDYSAFALTSRRIMNFNGRVGYWSETRR